VRSAAALAACVGAALLAGAGAFSATPVESSPVLPATAIDNGGRSVTVRSVERIVPLNGDLAETIYTLGLGRNVVATDLSATYPPAATRLHRIGYQRELSAEGIISLRPTVVVGSSEAGPPTVIQQLRDAGLTVLILQEDERLEAGPAKLRALGRALGVPKRGARLARQVERQIALARAEAARATSRPRVAFLYLRGDRVQMIGGRGTRAHTMIEAAGGVDVGAEIGIEGYRPITAEALVAARPSVLLVLSAGLESVGGLDGLLRIPGVAQTPAGAARRVVAADDLKLLGLGPRTGSALRLLVRALHPELQR
jgi:iron complex transport system substrate-binding protein